MATETTLKLENTLRSAVLAMAALKYEYGYNPETNLFACDMPLNLCYVRNGLHDVIESLIAAIDPHSEREHGWWEKYDTFQPEE